jgi:hypothetical protein
MATICDAYPNLEAARRAAAALRRAGVPARDIGVFGGSRYHDLRAERAGGFGGPVTPEAPFGKFAGPARRRWQAAGGYAGAPDRERQGSFADTSSSETITFDRLGEHRHTTSERSAWRRLADAHVPPDVGVRMLAALRDGRAVLIAELSEVDYGQAAALAHAEADTAC